MSDQLTMLRRTARVGAAEDVLVVADMAEGLLELGYTTRGVAEALAAVLPTQGNVSAHDRLKELLDVVRAYTPEFVLFARKHPGAAWHLLREPARWWREGKVEREDVEAWFQGYVKAEGHWPKIDTLRHRYGFAPTTKRQADQGALEGVGQ